MRICLIASSQFPIREPFAGGLEAHTHAIARSLTARGHDVTLFAAEGSDPQLDVESLLPEEFTGTQAGRSDVSARPEDWMRQHHAYLGLMLSLAEDGTFDVVHNNSLHHLPVAMSSMVDAPIITTLHTPPTPWLESAIPYSSPTAQFVAVSEATAAAWRPVVKARTILNGVDVAEWTPGPGGEGAVWTGRLVPEKAPHLAVDAARAAGMPISLAGPVLDRSYFSREIAPRLGPDVVYRGHLTRAELVDLVGGSAVAVVSSQWDEPYGLVAAEAMACGTPVAATPRGGLVELVSARSGALAPADTAEDLAAAMRRAAALPREEVRRWAEEKLSLDRMIGDYERLYCQAASAHQHAAMRAGRQAARAA